MSQTFVVVGGGLAAAKAVEELRSAGFDGDIVVYGEEHHLPYERPPLSKGYLLGDDELESAFVHDPDWYDDNDVDLRLGQRVTGLDTAAKLVRTDSGTQTYDKLLLATGSTPRHLAMADESGAPVAYLRTIEDSQRLKESFTSEASVAIIGAGWIGLETAAAARKAGAEVTVRCCGSSAPRSPRSSTTCTPSTAWTSGSASRSPPSSSRAAGPSYG